MSTEEFRFKVIPTEDLVTREERWDVELTKLQSTGLTVQGVGPDGDYPVRYDFAEDGSLSFDEWMQGNVDAPWFEVYNTVPLEQKWTADVVAFADDPDFDEALASVMQEESNV